MGENYNQSLRQLIYLEIITSHLLFFAFWNSLHLSPLAMFQAALYAPHINKTFLVLTFYLNHCRCSTFLWAKCWINCICKSKAKFGFFPWYKIARAYLVWMETSVRCKRWHSLLIDFFTSSHKQIPSLIHSLF